MEFNFESNWGKRYFEILPTAAFSWAFGRPTLYLGWLLWSLNVEFRRATKERPNTK